jgi:parallel beta-helix repeat protein
LGDSGALINLPFDATYWLGIKVGTDPELSPRITLTSVGYAYRAQTADTAYNALTVSYAHVFTVAQSGGDFTTINGALDSCVNPGPNNTYLIRVMPGTYPEMVTCSSFVRLQGAGKYVCRIEGGVMGADSCTIDGFWVAAGIRCFGTSPTITHNIITNEGVGIWITDGGRPWIKENEIIDCGGFGIHCDGWGTDAWIIANKIERNDGGGIQCSESSPTISNNQILENHNYGIYLVGIMDQPSEPTIDDNVIGRTDPDGGGIGIYMTGYAEPRIIANDIWVNYTGIEIQPYTQPSILANNINYNHGYGIRCFSSGASRPVTIKDNHIHSNTLVGIDVGNVAPIITHNNLNYNMGGWDIRYVGPNFFPMISFNVFDNRNGAGATGLYNVTSAGATIVP